MEMGVVTKKKKIYSGSTFSVLRHLSPCHGMTVADLSKATGANKHTVRLTLARIKKAYHGLIKAYVVTGERRKIKKYFLCHDEKI